MHAAARRHNPEKAARTRAINRADSSVFYSNNLLGFYSIGQTHHYLPKITAGRIQSPGYHVGGNLATHRKKLCILMKAETKHPTLRVSFVDIDGLDHQQQERLRAHCFELEQQGHGVTITSPSGTPKLLFVHDKTWTLAQKLNHINNLFPGWKIDSCASALNCAFLTYEPIAVEQLHRVVAYLSRPTPLINRPKLAAIKKIDKPYYVQPRVASKVEIWAAAKKIPRLAARVLGVLASNKTMATGGVFELVQTKLAITLNVAQGDISRALRKLSDLRIIEAVDAVYYPGLKAKSYKLSAAFLAESPALYTEPKQKQISIRQPKTGNNHSYLVKIIGWAVGNNLTLESALLSDLSQQYNEIEVAAIYRSLKKREETKHGQQARKRA